MQGWGTGMNALCLPCYLRRPSRKCGKLCVESDTLTTSYARLKIQETYSTFWKHKILREECVNVLYLYSACMYVLHKMYFYCVYIFEKSSLHFFTVEILLQSLRISIPNPFILLTWVLQHPSQVVAHIRGKKSHQKEAKAHTKIPFITKRAHTRFVLQLK